MKCVDELAAADLRGKRVLLRASLDLPVDERGNITDTFRLKQALPTIMYLKERGARIIVIAKIGRDPQESLRPVAEAMQMHLPVFFVPDILGTPAQRAIAAMKEGEILMLENLQQDPREVAGDDQYARAIASCADLYVNDCFPSAHRTSASMTGIPKFLPSYAGLELRDEIVNLNTALTPPSPSFAIIGGAKFETKDPIIRALLKRYDHVAVVGAIANDVLKVQGYPVGRSKISDHAPDLDVVRDKRLIGPIDVIAERSDKQAFTKHPDDVIADDKIVDIGADTVALYAPYLTTAKFIIWNGPTGLYEEGYTSAMLPIAEMIAHAVANGASCVIGGGDTLAALQESGVAMDRLGFLSTGGGAMLEYLLKGTLPGIEALN